jgi:hypothetical protein
MAAAPVGKAAEAAKVCGGISWLLMKAAKRLWRKAWRRRRKAAISGGVSASVIVGNNENEASWQRKAIMINANKSSARKHRAHSASAKAAA